LAEIISHVNVDHSNIEKKQRNNQYDYTNVIREQNRFDNNMMERIEGRFEHYFHPVFFD
jgi:hypothetical protein